MKYEDMWVLIGWFFVILSSFILGLYLVFLFFSTEQENECGSFLMAAPFRHSDSLNENILEQASPSFFWRIK